MRYAALLLLTLTSAVPLRAQETLAENGELQEQLNQQAIQIRELREQLKQQQVLLQSIAGKSPAPSDLIETAGEISISDRNSVPAETREAKPTFQPVKNDFPPREIGFSPAPVADTPSFIEALSTVASRTVNGRVHIDQWGFPRTSPGINLIENGAVNDDPENRLLYRRIRLGVRGTVPPGNMSYRMEIEFSGQDGSQFRDAWIGWDDLLVVQTLRLGNQKRPYGWDHLNSSNFMVFMERPLIVDALNEDTRRFGLASHGVTADKVFHWQYGVYYLPRVQDVGSIVNDRFQPEIAGRLGHTFYYDDGTGEDYAHWAVAGAVAWPDGQSGTNENEARFRTRPEGRSDSRWLDTGRIDGANRYEILALDSVLNCGPIQFAGELMAASVTRVGGEQDESLLFYGGYVYASWFLTGEHIPWNRQLGVIGRVRPRKNFICDPDDPQAARGWGAWQLATRLSMADLSDKDILGGTGRNATVAVNWYWNSHARLQFNYIFGRVNDRRIDQPAGPVLVEGRFQTLGVRCMIDF